ncbi:unnamed protein product [Cuscuta epithymum]|uniref:Uncharacterized protein n=1 Tax=Cuscuta epithymum TaxID=186058 RepID=A0AAV0CHZ8_9ASTE|nr:unnamed protein product [Cuscuta epithymum]CAH9076488.1 unnamed protein product [Cuscuta epithymum]CAH9139069.1 unnamed protein product [Cuscuta epithymum]
MMVKKPFTSPLCSKQATTSSANTYVSYPNIYHILSALELKYLMVQVQMLLYIVTEPVMLLSYMPLSEKLKKLGFVTYSNSQRCLQDQTYYSKCSEPFFQNKPKWKYVGVHQYYIYENSIPYLSRIIFTNR